jgi:hypothetical protein
MGTDERMEDKFSPISGSNFFKLPSNVNVIWIDHADEVEKIELLRGEEFIGIDSEWKPAFTKFDIIRPSILQLGGLQTVCIIDLIALAHSKILDDKLVSLFSDPKSTIVSYSFASDLSVFAKALP